MADWAVLSCGEKVGMYRGLLASFYHSDPILTHLLPWAHQGHMQSLKKAAVLSPLAALFYRVQRGYDLTVVSSRVMEDVSVRGPSRWLGYRLACRRCSSTDRLLSGRGKGPARAGAASLCRPSQSGKRHRTRPGGAPTVAGVGACIVTVIGRGGAADAFARLQHPRFRYLGFIEDAAQVKNIYDSHDILLAPGPFESFGLSVLEAMARGMVVVGPDEGGTAELLRQAKSTFIFSAGNPEEFFRAILAAIDCDQRVESARSRDVAVRYGTLEQAMGRLVDLYASEAGEA